MGHYFLDTEYHGCTKYLVLYLKMRFRFYYSYPDNQMEETFGIKKVYIQNKLFNRKWKLPKIRWNFIIYIHVIKSL